ncbi:MAG TPA: DUF2520 domain-containing protein [Syntrophales bacterium]|nr:DUF2520 domain-containing protein [Syntrophales bacterium]
MNKQEIRGDAIAILGLGKVGTAVGFLLKKAGYRIVAVATRSTEARERGKTYTGGKPKLNFADAAREATCIFITTTDDSIASVCNEIASRGGIKPGAKVIHMSGAGGLDLLAPARSAGARTACIHPLQSFPDIESAIANIPGSTFGITSDDTIKEWCSQVVKDLGGTPVFISDEDKPLYHAAACIASNYLAAIIHMVEEIYGSIGLSREDAVRSNWPLVMGTLGNIESKGAVQALTGPIARGDTGTVKKHLAALQGRLPGLLQAYKSLGIITCDIGLKKKTLSHETAQKINELLERGE